MMNADFLRLLPPPTLTVWLCLLCLTTHPILSYSTSPVDISDSLRIEVLLDQLVTRPIQQKTTLKALEKFELQEFSEVNKNKIIQVLKNPETISKELILFAGFLNIKEILISLSPNYQQDKPLLQYINLALVRAGDVSKIEILYQNLLKLPINDDFVYEVLPLLIYTKQIKIYDWLLTTILSDEKNCHPADAEIPGNINCAYRIIEALAPNIINFPIAIDKWGDLKTDNYSKALVIVRNWIEVNQGSYKINILTY